MRMLLCLCMRAHGWCYAIATACDDITNRTLEYSNST